MAWHNYKKLNDINIISVMKKLDIDTSRGKRALCFLHDDHNPSLSIYERTNSWFCFTCNKGGNVIELVKSYFNYDTDEACRWLEIEFGITPKPTGWKWIKKKRVNSPKNYDEEKIAVDSEILEWVISNTVLTEKAKHFLFEERKIREEVCECLNIKAIDYEKELIEKLLKEFGEERIIKNHIIEKGQYGNKLTWNAPCLLFPYYDANRKMVNIQSRYLNHTNDNKIPRFRFIKDSKTSIFNAQLLPRLKQFDSLLLTEGVTDCLAALSFGINSVAIPGASAFKNEYIDLLKNFTLFICPDTDKAGGRLMLEIKEKMKSQYCVVRELKLDDGSKDIGEYYSKYENLRFGK